MRLEAAGQYSHDLFPCPNLQYLPRTDSSKPITFTMSASKDTMTCVTADHHKRRACDACHRRKIKCISDKTASLCKQCASTDLSCTYEIAFKPRRRGGKVVSALRERDRMSRLAVSTYGIASEACLHTGIYYASSLSLEVTSACMDHFFASLHSAQPVLRRQSISEIMGQSRGSIEAHCLLLSLCSYTLIQQDITCLPNVRQGLGGSVRLDKAFGQIVLRECLDLRKRHDYIGSPSVSAVITSFFLFRCFSCLGKRNAVCIHLREATMLAHLIGMHDELHYGKIIDKSEVFRRRCLYWLLFINETKGFTFSDTTCLRRFSQPSVRPSSRLV